MIADTYMIIVYDLARCLNRHDEVIPCLEEPPSAERRSNQTNQDALPPCEMLDQVFSDYIEENASAEDIAGRRKVPLRLVQDMIRGVRHNEYKRQQAAPNLKVTPKAFGIGRLFPIAHTYR